MVLWWKPQVCPGSPLAQGIFNLVRNLKNVYELSVAHLPPFRRSAKITNSGTILRNFWFNNWWVGYFFFLRLKKFFKWLVLAVRAPAVLRGFSPSPAPREAECRVESTGTRALGSHFFRSPVEFSTPTPRLCAPPFPYLCSKDSVPRKVTINIFFNCKVKVLVA